MARFHLNSIFLSQDSSNMRVLMKLQGTINTSIIHNISLPGKNPRSREEYKTTFFNKL